MGSLNQKVFFDEVRPMFAGGILHPWQVDGMTRILNYRDENYSVLSDASLAYILATVFHETAQKMQPIAEAGSDAYLRSKPYWPWIGRGLVQLTWQTNFAKFGVKNPIDAQSWPVALDICFRGMTHGMFTGRKLSDFLRAGDFDYFNARTIINGHDRAALVAGYASHFRDALTHARAASLVS